MCKLVITQSEYLYNCLYFFIMILERNVFIFLTSVPDVSSVGLTLWLVWWDSYLCIEPLLWWILCMQCLGNTVGNMGEELILGAFDQFVFIYFIILLINCEKQHACACAFYFVLLLLRWSHNRLYHRNKAAGALLLLQKKLHFAYAIALVVSLKTLRVWCVDSECDSLSNDSDGSLTLARPSLA